VVSRTSNILQHQLIKIGFAVGWNSDDFTYKSNDGHKNCGERNHTCKNMIVAGVVYLSLCDSEADLGTTRKDSVIMVLRQNCEHIQTMYHTIQSNIEYFGNLEVSQSQNHLFQDLSILGLYIDCCGKNYEHNIVDDSDEILKWLSSTIDLSNSDRYKSSLEAASNVSNVAWKLFVVPAHNKMLPPIVIVGSAHAITRLIAIKQIVYYNANDFQYPNIRDNADVENIQVLWNHHGCKPYSVSSRSGADSCIGYTGQQHQQPWLMRLTHAAFVTQLLMNDNSKRWMIKPGQPHVVDESQNRDVSIKSKVRLSNQLLFRHSLFARHCYNLCLNTEGSCQSSIPIVKVMGHLLSNVRTTQLDRPLSSSSPIKTYNEIVHERIAELDQSIKLYIDAVIGILIGTTLFYVGIMHMRINGDDGTPRSSFETTTLNMIRQHYEILHTYMRHLENFPLGFKLNQDLLYNVGCEIQRIWKLHEYVTLEVIVPHFQSLSSTEQSIPVFIMSLFAFLFGASGCMAILFDIIHFGTLHISIFAWLTIRIYFYELYLLSTLWKLFRGKKCNILRNGRTDSMEYDSMQLLVGTIFFAIVLFLFTTIFVGHLFYTILYFSTVMIALPILLLYVSLQMFPWGVLWFRQKRPGWFTREIYLSDVGVLNVRPDSIDVTKICYRPYVYRDIMSDTLFPRLQRSTHWIFQSALVSLIGAPTSWNDFLNAISPIPMPKL
jgi:hypothetical protein